MGSAELIHGARNPLGAVGAEAVQLHERGAPRFNLLFKRLHGVVGDFHIVTPIFSRPHQLEKSRLKFVGLLSTQAIAALSKRPGSVMNFVMHSGSSSAVAPDDHFAAGSAANCHNRVHSLFPHARIETKGDRLADANSLEMPVGRIQKVMPLFGNYCRRHG